MTSTIRSARKLIAVSVCSTLVLGAASAAEFNLTYASPYSTTHPYGAADEAWIERIEEQTNGRVDITAYWGRSLISSREGVDELEAGIADMAYITPIYATSGYELNRLTPAFFYGYSDPAHVLAVYQQLWEEFPTFAEELGGVRVLGFNVGTPMHLQLRDDPVNTLDDLRGLRIRSANDYIGALAEFGAEGVAMPMGDTYPALQRGVLDGVIAPYEALKSLSFGEVVEYYVDLPHSRGAYASRAMNQAVWDSLPEDIQAVFLDNIDWLTQKNLENSMEAEEEGKAFGVEQGVTFIEIAASEKERYAETFTSSAREVAENLDERGLPGSEILEQVRQAHQTSD
ncbi:TRAP transporter substrate-binding protein [Saccharospirillum sp.]|uniref:TRAP transporter substrate-binding protein n=1 Tax=Saccharospirillum sp. TaxID=2033801 RepID=UPI0034A06E78